MSQRVGWKLESQHLGGFHAFYVVEAVGLPYHIHHIYIAQLSVFIIRLVGGRGRAPKVGIPQKPSTVVSFSLSVFLCMSHRRIIILEYFEGKPHE